MSILGELFHKIFPSSHPANANAPASSASASTQAQPAGSESPSGNVPAAVAASPQKVDVESVLRKMQEEQGTHLNWQNSIVDLLKIVKLDSSLEARKTLAHELEYQGDMNDSARMNIWLHAKVMEKIAANGGQVPASMHG